MFSGVALHDRMVMGISMAKNLEPLGLLAAVSFVSSFKRYRIIHC